MTSHPKSPRTTGNEAAEDLVAVHKIKETLKLDRPDYVGMCILDLSKTLMYDFHYNYIKRDTITRLNYYLQIKTAFVMK